MRTHLFRYTTTQDRCVTLTGRALVCEEDVQRRGVLFTSFVIERSDVSLGGARLNWNSTQREQD